MLKGLQLPGLSSHPHMPSFCRALWQLLQSPLLPAQLMLGICPQHSLSLAKPCVESGTPACVFLQSLDLRGHWVLAGLQDLSVPITLRASTCPRKHSGWELQFYSWCEQRYGKNWARSSLLGSRGDSGEGRFWRGAKQLSGAEALAATVGECSISAFHSLSLLMLFGVPKFGPTMHPAMLGVSLAMLKSRAMLAVDVHGSR